MHKYGGNHYRAHCESNIYKCANCLEDHMASEESCIFFKFHKKVNEIRLKLDINFFEATQFVLKNYHSDFDPKRGPAYEILHKFITNDDDIETVDSQESQVATQVVALSELDNNLVDKASIVNTFSVNLIKSIEDLGDPNLIKIIKEKITTTNNDLLQPDVMEH